MKKLINFLIFVVICLIGVFYLWSNPETTTLLGNTIYAFFDNLGTKNVEMYNNDIKINKMQISKSTFYYDKLTDDQKYIYSSVAQSVKELKNKVTLKDYKVESQDQMTKDVDVAISTFFSDHPEVFYLDNRYYVSTTNSLFGKKRDITLNYLVANKMDLDGKIDLLNKQIDLILSKASGLQGIDAEIALHDELMLQTEYYEYDQIENLPINTHNIYGTLIEKKAVCDGFAKTLQILFDRVNIESIIVLGSLENEAHAWNLVKLYDDNWYQLDFTSNKSVKNTKINGNILIHSYFNLTTEEILNTHSFDNKDIVPLANSTKYNYYVYKNKYISSVEEFNLKFKKILDNNQANDLVEFKVDSLSGNIADKIVDVLQNKKYSEYSDGNKITYYKILNTYIVMKNK